MVYKQIKVNITEAQLKKALNEKPIQLKASQIGEGDTYLSLHPANVKIVEKSAIKGRGCVLHLSPAELLATEEDSKGAGLFKDIYKKLKSGYKFIKKNVIDTELYQQVAKPLVRSAVEVGASALKTLAPTSAPVIDIIKEKIGKETGAFGIKTGKKKTVAQRKELLAGKGLYLS